MSLRNLIPTLALLVLAACGAEEDDAQGGTNNASTNNADNNGGNNNTDNNTDNSAQNNTDNNADNSADNNADNSADNSAQNNADNSAQNNGDNNTDNNQGAVVGRCDSTNPFSRAAECKQYTGASWDVAGAEADCAGVLGGPGVFMAGQACPTEGQGRCIVGDQAADGYALYFLGTDAEGCALSQTGCETFARGTFEPSALCGGDGPGPDPDPDTPPSGVFLPPTLTCQAPNGEDAASGDEVCTWNAISACTEPGLKFADYASCDAVRSQRPYYPSAPEQTSDPNDPRLQDETFMQELAWVTEQIDACACGCCHTESLTPNGASLWDTEAGPIWTDTIPNEGVAMMAGLVDSTVFGAFPPADNNGFDRSQTGAPTTDIARMRAFFEREFLRRGNTVEDAQEIPPFGGPLVDQYYFEPSECRAGQGIDAQGSVWWSGARARYVYVLEEGSDNPGVPPNLDLPEGTIWKLATPPTGTPMTSGVPFGEVPDGAEQVFPVEGAPAALVEGQRYYLYAMIDVGLPIVRCTFTYPIER